MENGVITGTEDKSKLQANRVSSKGAAIVALRQTIGKILPEILYKDHNGLVNVQAARRKGKS